MSQPATEESFKQILTKATSLRRSAKFHKGMAVFQVAVAAFAVIPPPNWLSATGLVFLALASLGLGREAVGEAERIEALPARWGKGERLEALTFEGLTGGPLPRRRPELDPEEQREILVEYTKLVMAKSFAEVQARTYKVQQFHSLGWLWFFAGLAATLAKGAEFAWVGWAVLAGLVVASLFIISIYRVRGAVLRKRVDVIQDKIIYFGIADEPESLLLARDSAIKVWDFVRGRNGFFESVPS